MQDSTWIQYNSKLKQAMKTKKITYCMVIIAVLFSVSAFGQSSSDGGGGDSGGSNSGLHIDPTRAAILEVCKEQETKELNSLQKALPLQATSHTVTGTQLEQTRKAIEDFRSYLDSTRHYIAIAADLYFMYMEVGETIKNVRELETLCNEHPDNAFAVALSQRKSHLYKEIASEGILIASDVRQALFSKTKMTEYERYNILSKIRPKLQRINKKIKALQKYIRYTNFTILWDELIEKTRRYQLANTGECARQAMGRWKYNYGCVTVK